MDNSEKRTLLILDLDETLVHSSEARLDRAPDFLVGPYSVYKRPRLESFLKSCQVSFQIAVWSSSGTDYLSAILREIFPADLTPAFVWDRNRCTQRMDFERQLPYFVKDLKKVKRIGYNLSRVLIVEDSPEKVQRNFGNAIYVAPFFGDPLDNELELLSRYLTVLGSSPDVRNIEKRGWRNHV